MQDTPVDSLFKVHRLNQNGFEKAKGIALAFDRLLEELKLYHCADENGASPMSREFALVRTHLELAGFYAKKTMAQQNHNQEK